MKTITNITKLQRNILCTSFYLILSVYAAFGQQSNFVLSEQGVFKKHGVDVMIYNDSYNAGGFFDEKVNGIEMIQHGVRTVTGGAVRLSPTPEQWDLTPVVKDRVINKADNTVMVTLYYKEYDFTSKIKVEAKDSSCLISVILDKPLPRQLEDKAGMNIEFLPSAYFKKTYVMDDQPGICPLVPTGPMGLEPLKDKTPQWGGQVTAEIFGNTYAKAFPMATGQKLVLSPDDPKSLVSIKSLTGEISFLDGRNLASNGWFVVRELIPSGKTGTVVQWLLTPNSISDWVREPVISHSQVGYHPDQDKIAVIELDPNDKPLPTAALYRVNEDGTKVKVLENKVETWGKYLRYNYLKFNFTSVKEPGIYEIQYGKVKTEAFPISTDVYKNTWHPTLDVWFPVQMDHMFVKEAYRIWHGASHLDDALQAPTDTLIHDMYRQDHHTDSPYKPLEHIPGLNIGGWYDAGDFDIRTHSHCETILYMVGAWEDLKLKRDQTMVDKDRRYVAIHHPDGVPDLLQQIEHGTLALIAQHRSIGHAISGIIVPHLYQYDQIGDGVDMTDGRVYNPNLKPYQTDGNTSGTPDDRWAFTNTTPMLNFQSVSALAAASRALRTYNDTLANECLMTAKKDWDKEVNNKSEEWLANDEYGLGREFLKRWRTDEEARATVELLVSTGDKKYAEHLKNLWPSIKDHVYQTRFLTANLMPSMVKALPFMDMDFKNELREQTVKFKKQLDSLSMKNPYGVPLGQGGFWEGNYLLVDWALCTAKLHEVFPDIIGEKYAIRGLDYVLGCHPASSISFVSGVGTNSKRVTYGNNRGDFAFIPGGVVPGVYLIKPDFYENKEDWPFIWYENECVIDVCAGYIYLAATVNHMMHKEQRK
jgi:hypothetical protein